MNFCMCPKTSSWLIVGTRCLAGVIEVLQVVVMIGAHTPSGPHSGLVLFKDCAYNSPIACQRRRCGFDP